MKIPLFTKYPNLTWKHKNILPIYPKSPKSTSTLVVEPLESRLLLSIINFADQTETEIEPNNVTPGQELIFGPDTLALGLIGDLADADDVDTYNFTTDKTDQIDLMLEITEGGDQNLTALAVAQDNIAYSVANNSVWRIDTAQTPATIDIWVSLSDMAQAAGLTTDQVIITDLALTSQDHLLITLAGHGDIFSVDSNQNITTILTTDEITAFTELDSADLECIAVDGNGEIYVADQQSGSVLQISPPGLPNGTYSITYYAPADQLTQYLQEEIIDDILYGTTEAPRTVIAQPEDSFDFQPNSLVYASGSYATDGFDVYYATQLGQTVYDDGNTKDLSNGTITRIAINRNDPEDVTFTKFFDPQTSHVDSHEALVPLRINPSALALDTNGAFGGKLFMGSFGPGMGDDHDGKIFTVDENGDLTEFVTQFTDPINGETFTGFFDVTDMAFSYGGSFGTYLYVLSENIDNNGNEEGGFTSDLWRVSPNGVAQLFVPDIADGVISLVFSSPGNLSYGGDLFVGTWYGGGQVLRVKSNGNTSKFFDFGVFAGGNLNICDLAMAPITNSFESPLEGSLILTLKEPQGAGLSYLFRLDPNPQPLVPPDSWGRQLNAGDVSSGDIAFDDRGNLIIAMGGDQNLTQMHYQTLFDYTFDDLQIRPITIEQEVDDFDPQDPQYDEITVAYVPYVSIDVADQTRIIGLGQADNPDDIANEVSLDVLDQGDVPEDGSKNVTFTFDSSGDIYFYVQNRDFFGKSSRSDSETPDQQNPIVEGSFDDIFNLLVGSEIDEATGLIDAQVSHLVYTADGSFFALGSNGTEPPEGEEPPSQILDDTILRLRSEEDNWDPQSLIQIDQLTRLQVTVTGPSTSEIFEASPGSTMEETIQVSNAGTYTITISSITPTSSGYELLISQGAEFEHTIIVDQGTGVVLLTSDQGNQLEVTYTGKGQIELQVDQKPTGKIINMNSLSILRSKSGSSVTFVSLDEDAQWSLDEIILDGSLGSLIFPGSVNTLAADQGSRGTIYNLQLGAIRNIETPQYHFRDFHADALGDPDITECIFDAGSLRNLYVAGNIDNMTFFDSSARNHYRDINIDGTVNGAAFYGYSIDSLLVSNNSQTPQETAVSNSSFDLNDAGYLKEVLIAQGNVVGSNFNFGKKLDSFEITHGSLEQSTIKTGTVKYARINEIVIGSRTDKTGGNITDSQIQTTGRIKLLYVDGQVSAGSQIAASGLYQSRIDKIITGGDFAGSITSTRVKDVLIGFQSDSSRKPENDNIDSENYFVGADFTGSISAIISIDELNVTGKIQNASLSCQWNSIDKIFAEDGFIATNVSAGQKVDRIMVGYIAGKRSYSNIINYQANVSGAINAPILGRIYYTGDEDINLAGVKNVGPIHDDISSITIEDLKILEDSDAATAELTVNLSQASDVRVKVDFATADNSATTTTDKSAPITDNDYRQTTGKISFAPGQTSKTIRIPITTDNIYEQDETFFVNLTNAVNATIGDAAATVTIENDDSAPTLTIANVSMAEGDSGTTSFELEVTLTLANPTSLPVTVKYATDDDTATLDDNDYLAASGTLTFQPDGTLTQTIQVLVNGDTALEEDETFFINLTDPTNATITTAHAAAIIQNDD